MEDMPFGGFSVGLAAQITEQPSEEFWFSVDLLQYSPDFYSLNFYPAAFSSQKARLRLMLI
jgi:hypothetical protein